MGTTTAQLTCLDDATGVAGRAARQEFLSKYYRPLVLLPFMVALFIGMKLFGENSGVTIFLVCASLAWGMAVIGYHVYLLVSVRCPVCGWRFGRGQKCGSCGLPRHHQCSDEFEPLA